MRSCRVTVQISRRSAACAAVNNRPQAASRSAVPTHRAKAVATQQRRSGAQLQTQAKPHPRSSSHLFANKASLSQPRLSSSLPHRYSLPSSLKKHLNASVYKPRALFYATKPAFFSTTPSNTSNTHLDSFDPASLLSPEEISVGAKLFPVINQLQEVCSLVSQPLDLPQLVVIGSQSSGKSSVLESLVGRDFLPRGNGIVTRCPLILTLKRNSDDKEEFGEFLHLPGKKISDFNQIRKEIETETAQRAGNNKGISHDPILLTITSPHVLPLTLVDTPGVTRVPIGDQPRDIEKQIRNTLKNYISKNNTIIVAVSPANQDISTSDALQLAREVDPSGHRTIGVVTKLDLMDQGTDAQDILTGAVVPLRLGFVGVVNRSQLDINTSKDIQTMWRDEHRFFRNHPKYRNLHSLVGTRYLALKCNKLLTDHIRNTLPLLKQQVLTRSRELKQQLAQLGEESPQNQPQNRGWYLLNVLNKLSTDFQEAIEGKSTDLITTELNGGSRLRFLFEESFWKKLNSINPLDGLTLNQFRTALRNASGPRASLFVPEAAFEALARRQIEKLREPSLQCADLVLTELLRLVAQLETKDLQRFQVLRDRVVDVASNMMRKFMKPTNELINNLINIELTYINTHHPDFVAATSGVIKSSTFNTASDTQPSQQYREQQQQQQYRAQQQQIQQAEEYAREAQKSSPGFFGRLFGGSEEPTANTPTSRPVQSQQPAKQNKFKSSPFPLAEPPSVLHVDEEMTAREEAQINLIKSLITAYINIISKKLQDSVTKAIWHTLIEKSKDNLQGELVSHLYKEDLVPALLKESDTIVHQRNVLSEELRVMKKAKKILQMAELREDGGFAEPRVLPQEHVIWDDDDEIKPKKEKKAQFH